MSQFLVSARKYRPAIFDEVVGQEAVTVTLGNAIANKQIAHAYLFCGPRGVGKTTCARIFAKEINRRPETTEETDDSFNVFELDAASNNSVEDIRNLIDQVRIPPQTGIYKVYIIDEVHMLSQAAFNAFLKTLEEPPPHAIFILATTEKHKILPTILSRCQIFDFNRISVSDIAQHLEQIAAKEDIKTEPEALNIIAIKADGALRDALSLFDQLVSFTGKNLTYQAVIKNLNILDYNYYFHITRAILAKDISKALLLLDEIIHKGFDPHHFINGLAGHFRNLLVSKTPGTISLLETTKNLNQKYAEQSAACDPPRLIDALQICAQCDVQYRSSKNQRLLVELTLMQLCTIFEQKKKSEQKEPEQFDQNTTTDAIMPEVSKQQPSSQPPTPTLNPPLSMPLHRQKIIEKQLANPLLQTESDEVVPSMMQPVATQHSPQPKQKEKSETVSINLYLKENEETAPPSEIKRGETQKRNDPFTLQQLLEAWREMAHYYKKQKRESMYISLSRREPVLKENHMIEITVDNLAQKELINEEKIHLMEFLRNKLHHDLPGLEPIVSNEKNEKLPYTGKEKFSRLAKKNKLVLKLKDQLDLDIEY